MGILIGHAPDCQDIEAATAWDMVAIQGKAPDDTVAVL